MLVAMSELPTRAVCLRARRARPSPADVGLPDSGRRRTPGLRREEVAALAGVSIDYLVRLEQGRDTNPSTSVLLALADALRLTEEERSHLVRLTAIGSAPELCPSFEPELATEVEPSVRLLLDRMGPTPAFVKSLAFDVLATNASWEALVRPLGILDGASAPANLLRYTFLHPGARTAFPEWEAMADGQVAALRAAEPRLSPGARFHELLAELQAVAAFAERWSAHPVAQKAAHTKVIAHPEVGELRIDLQVLDLGGTEGQQVVVWLPADEATDDAIRRATVGEPALRVVGGSL
jgi:transcriptional regulator with XRE-family HTH domain